MTDPRTPMAGAAAGVPFLAVPPAGGARPDAPVVVAWHLLEPPRTEAALAAALPLAGLDAWRVYLGLPMSGSRMPAGGWDELMRLGYEDAVLNLHGPIVEGAAAEFDSALAELRDRLGIEPGIIGVMGGSAGAAVAQMVLAEGDHPIEAAVLVSPLVQLRGAVAAGERQYGITYPWSDASDAVADRLDFVARAAELGGDDPAAVLIVVGADDDPGILEPAAALRGRIAGSELVTLPGMAHALADEPGIEPAPQSSHAAEVDRLAVDWFRRHLVPGP